MTKNLLRRLTLATILSTPFVLSACYAQPTKQHSMMTSDFFEAIDHANLAQVQQFLKMHPNMLEQTNAQKQTPLMYTLYQGKQEIAAYLIENGANVNAQDQQLNTPFLYAGAQGDTNIVQLALKHGARFDIFNRYNGTALIPAAEKGHVDTVRLLANTANFPIDHVNRLGWTALMEAVILSDGGKAHQEVIEILLKAGANPHIPDANGITPLQHAKQKGYIEMVKLLQ